LKRIRNNNRNSEIHLKSGETVAEIGQLQKEETMLKTVTLGRHLSIQGLFVRRLPSGMMVVRVGDMLHTGWPVPA